MTSDREPAQRPHAPQTEADEELVPRPPPLPPRAADAPATGRLVGVKAAGSYGTIGLEVVLCMLAGLFLGQWLDGRFGTSPWLAVIGFFFGLAAAGNAIWRGWRDMQAETAREEREHGNPEPLPDPAPDEDDEDEESLDAPAAPDHPERREK